MSTRTGVDYARLADVAREEIVRAGYVHNSCILAARMVGIVLRQLGVGDARSMACEVDVFSPQYVAMQKVAYKLGRQLTEAETGEFAAAGAWRVMLSFADHVDGVDDHRRGYNGHVVTVVDRRWMLDPTLPQVNRPEKDLIVEPPFAWEIDYQQARARGHITAASNGTVSVHRLIPGRRDFVHAPDWKLVPRNDETIGRIIDRLTKD